MKSISSFSPFIVFLISLIIIIHIRKDKRGENKLYITKKNAFATLVTPAFAMGAIALGHTLKKHHNDSYDMVCLVTNDVNSTWRTILKQWWIVKIVDDFIPFGGYRRSWTKIRLWYLTEYKKIVYMDTDTLVFSSLSELFHYPELSCATDASPPQICNTGVIVIEPSIDTYHDMIKQSKNRINSHGIGDQGFINRYFKNYVPIPSKFNIPRIQNTGLSQHFRKNLTAVVHYVCKKPWKCGRDGVSYCGCGMPWLNNVWWEMFDQACINRTCMETWKE